MKFFVLLVSLCLVAPAASAQDVYQEFADTLKEQNQKAVIRRMSVAMCPCIKR